MTPRRLALLVVAPALLWLIAGCGATEGWAASVDGTRISESEFDDELQTIADNQALVEAFEAQGGTVSETDGSVAAPFAATWLTLRIEQVIVDELFEEAGLELTDTDRENAAALAESVFGSQEIVDEFPQGFRETLLDRLARRAAVLSSFEEDPPEDELRRVFEESVDVLCPSGRTVAHVLVASEAEADAVIDRVEAGEDLAVVATQVSTDPSAAENGGDLGCLGASDFVEEFDVAAEALEPGALSDPVQTEFGWHVIRVTPIDFETLGESDVAALADPETRLQVAMWRSYDSTDVNPRFGELVLDDRGMRVDPPTAPEITQRPEPYPPSTAPAVPEVPAGP